MVVRLHYTKKAHNRIKRERSYKIGNTARLSLPENRKFSDYELRYPRLARSTERPAGLALARRQKRGSEARFRHARVCVGTCGLPAICVPNRTLASHVRVFCRGAAQAIASLRTVSHGSVRHAGNVPANPHGGGRRGERLRKRGDSGFGRHGLDGLGRTAGSGRSRPWRPFFVRIPSRRIRRKERMTRCRHWLASSWEAHPIGRR